MKSLEAKIFSDDILVPVSQAARNGELESNTKLTGFLAVKGNKYQPGGLMVTGRSVNGWLDEDDCVLPKDLADATIRGKFTNDVQSNVIGENGACPMAWVGECWGTKKGYNTKKSAFWRVIHEVTRKLHVTDNDNRWESQLLHSNLYKLSPERGGNPSQQLMNSQFDGCKRLFQLELETYQPSRLLLLTGDDWAEQFLHHLHDATMPGNHVHRAGHLVLSAGHKVRIVIACHPQSRPEKEWVEQVLEYFGV